MVEIAKTLSLDVRVLIMDEPTAALSAHEVSELFTQIRRLTESGVAVLFISHHLDEVFEIADRSGAGADSDSVKVELMADCLAGVWASHAATVPDASGTPFIEPLTAADVADAQPQGVAVLDDGLVGGRRAGGDERGQRDPCDPREHPASCLARK